jgi:hypothetical protein
VIYRYWYQMGGGTQLSLNVSPPEYQSRTYTAYVAKDAPSPGPPTLEIRTESEVTVENLGWQGTITLTSNRTEVTAGSPSATLTATASRPLTSGYFLSVYDDLGSRLISKYWYEVPYTTRQVSLAVSPPLSQTRTYTAYIAKDVPTPGPPKTTVRATASLTFASGLLTSETMEGVDLTWLSGLATEEEIALALSAAPMATHAGGSSLSDQTLAYTAALAAGLTSAVALAQAASVGDVGASLLWWLADKLDDQEASLPATPSVAIPWPEPVVITNPLPRSSTPTFQDELTDTFLERGRTTARPIALVEAQVAAASCIALAAASISRQVLEPTIDGKHPCEALPIFLPGSTHPLATAHDWNAIKGWPAWISLNYSSESTRMGVLVRRDWWKNHPAYNALCPDTAGESCHEYPYFSSMQSGPHTVTGPPGAMLDMIITADNKGQGGLYGVFALHCLRKGVTPTQAEGRRFLVIPMYNEADPQLAPPTSRVCPW